MAFFHFSLELRTNLIFIKAMINWKRLGRSILTAGLGLCCFVLGAMAQPSLSVDKLVVALKPDKDPEKMLAQKSALEAYLSQELQQPVEVIIPMSNAVILEGFRNGTIDLAYLSSTDAARAMDLNVANILLVGEIDGVPYYQSYWITLKDKPYQGVEDLRGKPIAFSSRTSTSGFLIPVWDLHHKGLLAEGQNPEVFFGRGNVIYGIGYVSAAERVLSGQVEAAAVSDYVLNEDKHLSAENRARLRMMASQGPVPTHTLSVRRSLPAADQQRLKEVLLSMNDKAPELRDQVFTSVLIERDPDEHLKITREALDFVRKINL